MTSTADRRQLRSSSSRVVPDDTIIDDDDNDDTPDNPVASRRADTNSIPLQKFGPQFKKGNARDISRSITSRRRTLLVLQTFVRGLPANVSSIWTSMRKHWPSSGRSNRLDIFYWALFTSILAFVHLLLSLFGKSDKHGFSTLKYGTDFHDIQWISVATIQLPLNFLAGVIVIGSDYVRRCLLAPPKDEVWNPEGKLGYQSLAAWWHTTVLRKILWIALSLTSSPIHVLYNSIVFGAVPAYDAYEVLVDQRFFEGHPFSVAALNITEFKYQPGASMPFETPWPNQWPGSTALQKTLEEIQNQPSKWTNLTNRECRSKYGLNVYSHFRTVIMVTDWSQNLDPNNSALAVGTLPGFPPTGLTNRFMTLCPNAWIAATPNATVDYPWPSYIGTMDLPACRSIFAADCSTWAWDGVSHGTIGEDSLTSRSKSLARDLCANNHPSRVPRNSSHEVPLVYCLSEPLGQAVSRLVWSKLLTEIVGITLGLKAVTMLLAWLCVCHDSHDGFPNGFPWTRLGRASGIALLIYLTVNVAIVAFTFYIAMGYLNYPPYGLGSAPAHPTDRTFVLGILIFQNGLHALLVAREYFEANYFEMLDGMSKGKPNCRIPFSNVHFLWNLGLHQLISAWLGTAMLDRYLIGSVEERDDSQYIPTIITDSVLSGHTGANMIPVKGTGWAGVFAVAIPLYAAPAQVVAIVVLFSIFRKRIQDPASPSSNLTPRISFPDSEGQPLQANTGLRQYSTMQIPTAQQDRSSDETRSNVTTSLQLIQPSSIASLEELDDVIDLAMMSGAIQETSATQVTTTTIANEEVQTPPSVALPQDSAVSLPG